SECFTLGVSITGCKDFRQVSGAAGKIKVCFHCRIGDQDLTGFHESKLNGGCHQVLFTSF
ncbi:unnamed protein product, partial [Brassica rapa subsp. trilocularis]